MEIPVSTSSIIFNQRYFKHIYFSPIYIIQYKVFYFRFGQKSQNLFQLQKQKYYCIKTHIPGIYFEMTYFYLHKNVYFYTHCINHMFTVLLVSSVSCQKSQQTFIKQHPLVKLRKKKKKLYISVQVLNGHTQGFRQKTIPTGGNLTNLIIRVPGNRLWPFFTSRDSVILTPR